VQIIVHKLTNPNDLGIYELSVETCIIGHDNGLYSTYLWAIQFIVGGIDSNLIFSRLGILISNDQVRDGSTFFLLTFSKEFSCGRPNNSLSLSLTLMA
jgi:hypothetical protein